MDNMGELEDKIGQIMADPDMMGKLMSLAKNLNPPEPMQSSREETPMPDMAMVQKIASIAGKSGIDPKQKNLLRALEPYLPCGRLQKLEKAMQAAKMARLAAGLFGGMSLV